LADAALQNWPGGGYMPMPLFFLARHSIESQGSHRGVRSLLTACTGADRPQPGRLWNHLQKQIETAGFPNDDDWTRNKLIHHIHEIDPDGERFRYPLPESPKM
jgi:hypothetical protein